MKKISAVIRPFRLEAVKNALVDIGVTGMTISEVSGFGRQRGMVVLKERPSGSVTAFLQKLRVEIVVTDEKFEQALQTAIDAARTGAIGDGKIFISAVEQAIRIRTGESGPEVL